jgi:HEAT repeat protein
VLSGQGELSEAVVQRLTVVAATAEDYKSRVDALLAIATTRPSESRVEAVIERLKDEDNDVRRAASGTLVSFAAQSARWRARITQDLVAAIGDPAFGVEDRYEHRAGHDYAYDALWHIAERAMHATSA